MKLTLVINFRIIPLPKMMDSLGHLEIKEVEHEVNFETTVTEDSWIEVNKCKEMSLM